MRYLFIVYSARSTYILVTFLVLQSTFSFALQGPAVIERVCLNNNDTIATISWRMPNDLCNSYQRTDIYGRRQNDPFQLLYSNTDATQAKAAIKLPSLEQSWMFFIVLHSACNGLDSFISDTIGLDLFKPPLNELDSVSVDFNSQKIIAGWQVNTATDIKGYRLYTFSNAVNDSAGDTPSTFYQFNDVPTASAPQITLAAYDSCNLYSAISAPHRIMRLALSPKGDCSDSIDLSWTTYQGWGGIDRYEIHISRNAAAYALLQQTTNNVFTDAGIQYGDSICYFIRAWHENLPISSSSSISCYKRFAPQQDPNYRILNWSAHENGEEMVLVRQKSVVSDIYKEELQIKDGNNTSIKLVTFNENTLDTLFIAEKTIPISPASPIEIVLRSFDKCNQPLQLTDTFRNVVLVHENNASFYWNLLHGWPVYEEQLFLFSIDRFTWNTESSLTVQDQSHKMLNPEMDERRCYRVLATKEEFSTPPYINASSIQLHNLSNIICLSGTFQYYLPNAISPGGVNQSFYIPGTGINREKSELIVFNRWGELVYQGNLLYGWKPNDVQSKFGSFFFQLKVVGYEGEVDYASGPIYILP